MAALEHPAEETPRRPESLKAEGLSREQRLRRPREFQEAYAQGRRWTGRYMVLWLRSGEGAALRLGVVASRRIGGAVKRNRARRLLRELFRRERKRMRGDFDVVLVARKEILDAEWEELVAELRRLAKAAGLLPTADGQEKGP
ncbi:MAG: ribonuclease P protein component [Verrucomicrobia bacterium]|nr:MAG: ribonuclease P protein component [Verrucomicrobiota bacterium]